MKKGTAISDEELLELMKRKDEIDNAIRYIYSEYHEGLSSLITYNSGSWEDAQDIIQESILSFIQIVQEGKFRGESSIKTFLYSLTRNIWLNELKKRGRMTKRNKIFEEGKDDLENSTLDGVEKREANKQLLDILNELGEGCRKILTLFYYENLSMKEILMQTEFENEQVVRNKKHKCLKQLTETISNNPVLAENLKRIIK